jgi:hypothetical protein
LARDGGSTRRISFLIGALDALTVLLVTLSTLVVSTTVVWLFENNPSLPWLSSFRTALDIWFLGHGVSIHVAAGTIEGVVVPAFNIGLAPIALILGVIALGRRTARRFATARELWPGWVGAISVYWVVSAILTPLASTKAVAPVAEQAAYLPAILYGGSVIAASLFAKLPKGAIEPAERRRVHDWLDARRQRANWVLASISAPVLRAGTAVVVSLLAVSALSIAVLTAVNWIGIIRLYEGLQATLIGGLVLTLGQLVFLPNLVVFGASWFTGTGFSIGIGSHISPLGTELGPIPGFPIFGALPVGAFGGGMIAIVVPVIIAFVATLAIKRHAADVRFNFANPLAAALSVGVGVGFVAAVEMLFLGWFASGGIGPSRLSLVGVNPWMLALVTFVEVVPVSTLAAFYSAKPSAASPIPEHLKR